MLGWNEESKAFAGILDGCWNTDLWTMATEEEHAYLTYLLRLWQVSDRGTLVWRASLERANPNVRLGFSSLDELCHYLYEQTAAISSAERRTDIE